MVRMVGIFRALEKLAQGGDGGESGIRTRGTSLPTRFPVVPVRPLRHLSVMGPSQRSRLDDLAGLAGAWRSRHTRNGGESGIRTHGRVAPTTVFETVAFVHSAISPELLSSRCAWRAQRLLQAGLAWSLTWLILQMRRASRHGGRCRSGAQAWRNNEGPQSCDRGPSLAMTPRGSALI